MEKFLNGIRIDSVTFSMQSLLITVMFLQLGGIPSPKKSAAGKFFYWLWMIFVVEQWAATLMAAVVNVLALVSFELQNLVRHGVNKSGQCAKVFLPHAHCLQPPPQLIVQPPPQLIVQNCLAVLPSGAAYINAVLPVRLDLKL